MNAGSLGKMCCVGFEENVTFFDWLISTHS